MTTEAVEWIPAAGRLPDADLNVLCFDAESIVKEEGEPHPAWCPLLAGNEVELP